MKRRSSALKFSFAFIFILSITLKLSFFSVYAADNIIKNPSFEQETNTGKPASWNSSSWSNDISASFTYENSEAHSGQRFVSINNKTENDCRYIQTAKVNITGKKGIVNINEAGSNISLIAVYVFVFGFIILITGYYSCSKKTNIAIDDGIANNAEISTEAIEIDESEEEAYKSEVGSETKLKKYIVLIVSLILIGIMYILLYRILNQGILSHNALDSYTLQADAWWHGRLNIINDYSFLELATYKDNIFVSFPPVPSIIMFIIMPFFGMETPNNLISSTYTLLSYIFIYLLCTSRLKLSYIKSIFWALFVTFGGNLLSVSVNGGVWFQAQALSFLLTTMSLYFLFSHKRVHWYLALALWALSVGCRPFQIIYFPVYIVVIYNNMRKNDKSFSFITFINKIKTLLILPLFIGLVFGLYNFVRFNDPFEFGHNYLPEFINSPNGQFSLSYIKANLFNILRLPEFGKNLSIIFPKFDGFSFYIANPLFIVFFIRLIINIKDSIHSGKVKLLDIILPLCIFTHIVITLCHKTLGGWQFGARYFIDMLPLAFIYIIYKNKYKVNFYEIILLIFGISLNIYGTLWLFLDWM